MKNTCKDCEHYEFYDGPEKPCEPNEIKAVMKCVSTARRKELSKGGYTYYGVYAKVTSQRSCGGCDFFTPKKPKEEKGCKTCWNSMHNNATGRGCEIKGCAGADDKTYPGWQPIPKPGQATIPPEYKITQATLDEHKRIGQEHARLAQERVIKGLTTKPKKAIVGDSCLNCKRQKPDGDSHFYCKYLGKKYSNKIDTICGSYKKIKPPKQKETKMWKKLRKRARRITMAWDIFGIFLLCKLVNPCLFWLAELIKPEFREEGTTYSGITNELLKPTILWDSGDMKQIACVWGVTVVVVATILAALYALDRAATWYYGEK